MPFLMSFALEHEIVTFAWIDNASVQFPLNIFATKGLILSKVTRKDKRSSCGGSVENSETARFLAPESEVTFDRAAQVQGHGA